MTAPASPEAGRLTGEALEAIEARAAKATPGPLTLNRYEHGGGRLFLDGAPGERVLVADFYGEADREFYNAAREDVPALCREVRRLRAALEDAWREGIEFGCGEERSISEAEMQAGWRQSDARAALAPVATGTGEP